MVITKQQVNLLKPYIPSIQTLIQTDDLQTILDAIDDVIVDNILGNHDEPDLQGILLQRLYDQICNQN